MNKWRALWTTVGLAALVALTSIASGCVVKGKAGVTASGTVTVVDQQPPPPRYERPPAREGRVWLRGHWQWRNGQWVWRRGSWVRPRRGHHWEPGHWVLRSGRYHFVRGRWVRGRARAATPPRRDYRKAAVDGPSKAPPAPRYKRVRPRPAMCGCAATISGSPVVATTGLAVAGYRSAPASSGCRGAGSFEAGSTCGSEGAGSRPLRRLALTAGDCARDRVTRPSRGFPGFLETPCTARSALCSLLRSSSSPARPQPSRSPT
ncbi:MAG: YXWGXW repeat-containing protein [Deltaproteobacteria bacterium]|nr:YXWGXW repeat-containing protein [Deltaproteobacteria bacterium]